MPAARGALSRRACRQAGRPRGGEPPLLPRPRLPAHPALPACLPHLSAGLDKCRELNTLVLSHNSVASLGSWVGGLPKLEKLSLSHNQIKELGASLK